MAVITPIDNPTLRTLTPPLNCKLSNLTRGEEMTLLLTPVYIADDGMIYKSVMGADPAAADAVVDGWAVLPGPEGEKGVTIMWDVVVEFGEDLTPGTRLFLNTVAGQVVDAKTANDVATNWIAKVISATRVQLRRTLY